MTCRCGSPMEQVNHRFAYCGECGRLHDIVDGRWREPDKTPIVESVVVNGEQFVRDKPK